MEWPLGSVQRKVIEMFMNQNATWAHLSAKRQFDLEHGGDLS